MVLVGLTAPAVRELARATTVSVDRAPASSSGSAAHSACQAIMARASSAIR
jgi:hypothetical protein